MQLIVAEKPSVARDLARVLGVRPAGQHSFEGEGRVITWCIGHLVELDEPSAYDPRWKSWRLDTLPMLPAEFRLRPSKHAAPQLRAVTRLLSDRRFTSVVNACDAGREGELIFRYVYRFAGGGPNVLRLWISSLTDEAIRRGFAALRPGTQFDALGDAARSRSEADWLVGMNATRAITARGRQAGHTALYSIGRVQTPTLAMLVAREQAIRAFVPRAYWEVRGDFRTAAGQRFSAGWRHASVARLGTAALAEAVAVRDRAHGAGADPLGPRVEQVRARTTREPPPLLFDLTSLQRTANRRFGFSAARTLELAQALYERHKVLTYPRTDSRHLSSDVVPELPGLFAALAAVPEYTQFATELLARPVPPGRRVVDDTKVHDHHAIIPTGRPPSGGLDRDERRLFELVVRRFLGVFFPDAEFAITEVCIRIGAVEATGNVPATRAAPARGSRPDEEREEAVLDTLPPPPDRYFARGRVRLTAGWQDVAGIAEDQRGGERDGEADATPVLPPLTEGQALDGSFVPLAKHTVPPHRYTEATLLGAMESAGKKIDDEALRAAMKDCGLGTPATRAAVIETLLKRDYIVRAKQQLVPTTLGIGLIDALPVASLSSPELTGTWEARLARIARGDEARVTFMTDIARYVADMVDAIRGSSPPAAPDLPPVGSCPRCRSEVVERVGEFACSGTCGFAIRNRVAGRAITAALVGVLLERKRSQVLHGFRSKAGKAFAAMLVLDETGELRFEFENTDRARAPASPAATSKRARTPRKRDNRSVDREHAAVATRDRAPASRGRESRGTRSGGTSAKAAARKVEATRRNAVTAVAGELACPRCRTGIVIAGARGWGCSRWRDGCGFVIWFETAGRQLSATQLRDLITRGRTRKARFAPEPGVEAVGRLVLDPSTGNGTVRFEPH